MSAAADLVAELSDEEVLQLFYDWEGTWARPSQIEPAGEWTYWLIKAGRGFGKTRIGAEWTRKCASSGDFAYVNLIGATADDARDIMIEGESGILSVCPKWQRPSYFPSKRRLEWPNGCWSLIFTADEPARLRGKQHQRLWADELAAWRYPEAWDQAMFGLRLPPHPRACITTTPRPTELVKDLLADPACVVTAGSTYENRDNLAESFFAKIVRKYEGTRLGRQELHAEILEDTPGALWTRSLFHYGRHEPRFNLTRIVVAIDPGDSLDEDDGLSETGIVVAGFCRDDGYGYVLADGTLRGSPQEWASKAVALFDHFHADRIVAEKNHGGAMVESTIRTVRKGVSLSLVSASRGKATRAEPVAALYEQGRVRHVDPFPELEDQMTTWVPGDPISPDRMDALVWALTELMVEEDRGGVAISTRRYSEPVVRRGDMVLRGERYVDKT